MNRFEQETPITPERTKEQEDLYTLKKNIKENPKNKETKETNGDSLVNLGFEFLIKENKIDYTKEIDYNIKNIVNTMKQQFSIADLKVESGTDPYKYYINSYGNIIEIDLINGNIYGKSNKGSQPLNLIWTGEKIVPEDIQKRINIVPSLTKPEANAMYKGIYQLLYTANLTNYLGELQVDNGNKFQADGNRIDFADGYVNDTTAISEKMLKVHCPDIFGNTDQVKEYVKFLNVIYGLDTEQVTRTTGINLQKGFEGISNLLTGKTTAEKIKIISQELERGLNIKSVAIETSYDGFELISHSGNRIYIKEESGTIKYYNKKNNESFVFHPEIGTIDSKEDNLLYGIIYLGLVVNETAADKKKGSLYSIENMRIHAPFVANKDNRLKRFDDLLEHVIED